MTYRFKVFLLLTGGLVAVTIGWSVWRHETHAGERAAWVALNDTLRAQKARIDSLEAVINASQAEVDAGKARLGRLGERIGQFERNARGGRLPTPSYRAYRRTIDRHNGVVAAHNTRVVELQRIYAEYSGLVDRQNALIDSANAMQRAAVDEGYALPRVEPLK